MSMNGEIAVYDNPEENRFQAEVEGHLAIAQYVLTPGGIIFTHTEVPPELGGRGIATRLVEAGLASARKRGLSVIPRCGVFARYMQKHPETADLLQPDIRATLGI